MDGLTLFSRQHPAQASVVGNCVLVTFDSEDNAIMFLEFLKEMEGKNVILEYREGDIDD